MIPIQDFLNLFFAFTKEEKENAQIFVPTDESQAFLGVPNAFNGEGVVYVFTRIGSMWGFSQTLKAEDGESGGHFGKHVLLSENDVLVVSSENKTTVSGTPYCFKHDGEAWKICTPISIGVQTKEKDNNKQVRAAELIGVSNRCRSLGLPSELWVRLNNKLVDIAGAGMKASSASCSSQSNTISVHKMLALRKQLFKLWCGGFLNEVQFEELIGIAARYTKDAVSKTQKTSQQPPVETASTQLVNKAKQAKLDDNKKWDVFYDILEHRNTPPKLHALLYVKMLTMIGPPESARVPLFRENVEALFDSKALIKDIEKMVGDNLLHELSFKVFEREILKYVSSTYPFSDNCKHDVQNHQGETSVKNEKDQASQHSEQPTNGVNLNTALMSVPGVSEDGIIIARDVLPKLRFNIYETRQPGHPTTDMVYVFSESSGPQWVQRQSQHHVEQSANAEPSVSKQSPMENQAQTFTGQHTTQGETMNDKQNPQVDIDALLSAAILNKSDQEVRTLFSTFCSSAVSKGVIDPSVAAHLQNLFATYTKVPKGSTFQPRNPQFQPFAPMPPFMPMGFQQQGFPQPPNMGFQTLHPSQFQNPQAFRPNQPNQGARYQAELTLQHLDSQLGQTKMQLQQLEQAVENNKFQQASLNAQCAAIRNLLNPTPGK